MKQSSKAVALALMATSAGAARCLQWDHPLVVHEGREELMVSGRTVCAIGAEHSDATSCHGFKHPKGDGWADIPDEGCPVNTSPESIGRISASFGNPPLCKDDDTSDGAYWVGTTDPACGARWRFLTYDVWPIGSVVIAGKSKDGHKFGVCRFPDADTGALLLGKLYLSGSNMGACGCRTNGTEVFRIGEYEYLQADEGKGHLFDDVASNSNSRVNIEDADLKASLRTLTDEQLTEADRELLFNITGTPVSSLIEKLLDQPSETIRKVLSHERFVNLPELNVMGLHLLRCVLAERVADARRRKRGYEKHPDYETFMRDGILVKDFNRVSDQDLKNIMTMVSGLDERELPPLKWVHRPVKHMAGDAQYQMHVDTFHAAYKIWLYKAPTPVESGPLNYVKGSHRNTEGKLRWLYSVSLPPAMHILKEPSIRLNEEETEMGFEKRQAMATPANTFVIADTSGFHARGLAKPGTIRDAMRIEGPYDGGLPRKNPFFE